MFSTTNNGSGIITRLFHRLYYYFHLRLPFILTVRASIFQDYVFLRVYQFHGEETMIFSTLQLCSSQDVYMPSGIENDDDIR